MSTSVHYFFNSERNFEDLTSDINGWLGCNLAPYEDSDVQFDRFMGMELGLDHDHGFENDRDVNFEDYRYSVDIRIPAPDGDLGYIREATVSCIVHVLYCRMGISDGLLVYNTQRVIARYEERQTDWGGKALFDLVSNKFIDFPGHINDIYKGVYS